MCGIAGLSRHQGLAPDDVSAVGRMTEAQVHRGPCGSGIHSDGHIVLGHRRLSIIDVSAAGSQPMSNEDGSIWLTYNGEIYNHQELRAELLRAGHCFRSLSDTEVILHGYEEWGIEKLLEKLRGMFAFGLNDPRQGLLLARDRFGIKPLYYHVAADGLLLFASEVKAVLASRYVPNERDPQALAGFLLTGSIPSPSTIVKNVSSLPPGHYLISRGGTISVRKYWDLPSGGGDQAPDFDRLRELLQDSVTRQLVSDVPIGVFLGGGLDSGAIVAFASRASVTAGRPLTTLTVAFDEQEFSEEQQARAVALQFHTDHHEVRITQDEFIDELPKIFSAMDQPTNDGVNTYFVSKAAKRAGLTVVLSGLGGDEVFWGYRHYRWLAGPAGRLGQWPPALRKTLARGAAAWGHVRGKENWMRAGFLDGGGSDWRLYLAMRGFFPAPHVMALLGLDQRELDTILEQHFEGLVSAAPEDESAATFNQIEFKRYLHDQLLRDTDVFSMAHSIEVRVPFLDRAIVEYAASIRPDLKFANGINKPLLVGALEDAVLVGAAGAKKQGFSFPMDRWMHKAADELEDRAMSNDRLDLGAVKSLWSQFRAGRLHWSRAWALSVLGATAY